MLLLSEENLFDFKRPFVLYKSFSVYVQNPLLIYYE